MTTEITKIQNVATELATYTTSDLKAELAKSMQITSDHLVRMAAIVRILEDRGEDLSDLRFGLIGYLRKIACGQVLPEVVVKFSGAPLLLSKVAALPLSDQEKIVKSDTIRVAMLSPEGQTEIRTIPPIMLSRNDIHQVFATDHLRNESEQITYLRSSYARPEKRRRKDNSGVILDFKRRGIVVNGEFVPESQLAKYLSDLMSKNA